MQKKSPGHFVAFFVALLQFQHIPVTFCQSIQNDRLELQLSINGTVTVLQKDTDCGFLTAQFGSVIETEICGQVVWAFDETPDSLVCDTILTQDLSGKFALIRRGDCDFSLKAYNAQQAGALAVIMVNDYDNGSDGPCTLVPMSPGANAGQVTIPVVGIARQTGEVIDAALQANEPLTACFLLPHLYDPAVPYHYATPFTQVDTLRHMRVHYANRDTIAQTGIELKIVVTEPNGNVAVRTVTLDTLPPGADTAVFFPPYLPPAVEGVFQVLITSNTYTEPRDSLRGKFVHTHCTFASDNLVLEPGGVGVSYPDFISGGLVHQEGSLCITGPNGGIAEWVTFGIANPDSVFVPTLPPGATANDINVFLYDGDMNGNSIPDLNEPGLGDSFDDMFPVAYGVYTMDGNEMENWPITVPIFDFVTEQSPHLLPRHLYYVSIYYSGLEAGYGRDIRFSKTAKPWSYLPFPTTPVMVGNGTALQQFDEWKDVTVINRLHLEGCVIVDAVKPGLPEIKQMVIGPNPANDLLHLNLALNAPSERVTLTLFDPRGRPVKVQTADHFQEGRISLNVQDVPSGMYVLWVRAAEGSAMRKVVVCH